MSNVWGTGGLFEQALANKLQNQSIDSASKMLNAEANMQGVGNQYDLGLRNAGTDLLKAQTDMFNAESNRVNASKGLMGPVTKDEASNMGLRSFNPVANKGGVTSFLATNPLVNPAANTAATPAVTPAATTTAAPTTEKFGETKTVINKKRLANGTMSYFDDGNKPVGMKKGGKIGDVKKDTGADTVDVKAREGEYFLNPETVAFLGKGDYNEGVRNLDAIVRQATGKEPGPSPVGKSDKQGLADSGVVVRDMSPAARDMNAAMEAERAALNAKVAENVAKQEAAFNAEIAAKEAASGAQNTSKVKAAVDSARAAVNGPNATTVEGLVKNAGTSIGNAAKNVASAAPKAVGSFLRTGAVGAGLEGAYRGFNTDTEDYAKRMGVERPDSFLGDMGVRTLGVLSDVGASAMNGLALPYNIATQGLDTDKWWDYRNTFADVAEAKQAEAAKNQAMKAAPVEVKNIAETPAAATPDAAKTTGAPAGTKDESKQGQAEAPKEVSLRDMLINEYNRLSNTGYGVFGSDARTELLKQIGGLAQNEASASKGAASGALARQKEIDDRINERYQIPKFDKDGNVTGFEKDPNAAMETRNQMAERGIDMYSLSPAQLDEELRNRDNLAKGMRNFNSTVRKERGSDAQISNNLRGMNVEQGIGLSDVIAPNNAVTIGDWLTAKMSGDKELSNMIVRDPKTGQSVAARNFFKNDDGSIDQDSFDAYVAAQTKRQNKGK